MRRAGLLLAMVAAIVVGLPVAAGAAPRSVDVSVDATARGTAPVNQELLGLNHLDSSAAPALAPLGVTWSRIDASFEGSDGNGPVYNCSTGTFDPTSLDGRVAAARVAGAQPEILLDYTPACLAGPVPPGLSPSHNPPDLGADRAKWDQLVEEMALHEIEVNDVTTFEIWNEPNIGTIFWNGTPDQYDALYVDTATALESAARQAHRRIEIGGPALATITPSPDMAWVDGFLAYVNGHHAPLSFLSWHEYFNSPDTGPQSSFPSGFCFAVRKPDGQCDNPDLTPADLTGQIEDMRQAVATYPGLHPKLWLDEWNVNAGYDPRMDGTYGAAFVAAVLSTAQNDGLDRSDFYDAIDDSSFDDFGLLTQTGVRKPDYWTFDLWHLLSGKVLPVTLTPALSTASGTDEVGAVAARATGGVVNVLIYNFKPTGPVGRPSRQGPVPVTRPVAVTIDGLPRAKYAVSERVIDTGHAAASVPIGTLSAVDPVVDLSMSPQSVVLVTVTPVRRQGRR